MTPTVLPASVSRSFITAASGAAPRALDDIVRVREIPPHRVPDLVLRNRHHACDIGKDDLECRRVHLPARNAIGDGHRRIGRDRMPGQVAQRVRGRLFRDHATISVDFPSASRAATAPQIPDPRPIGT